MPQTAIKGKVIFICRNCLQLSDTQVDLEIDVYGMCFRCGNGGLDEKLQAIGVTIVAHSVCWHCGYSHPPEFRCTQGIENRWNYLLNEVLRKS